MSEDRRTLSFANWWTYNKPDKGTSLRDACRLTWNVALRHGHLSSFAGSFDIVPEPTNDLVEDIAREIWDSRGESVTWDEWLAYVRNHPSSGTFQRTIDETRQAARAASRILSHLL